MLEILFLQVLNMSFTAGVVIVFVMIARLLLKKAPKVFSCALWSVVLFRLVCPFSFESVFSLLPTKIDPIAQDIVYAQIPKIDTGMISINQAVNAVLPPGSLQNSVNPLQIWLFAGSFLWLLGIIILLTYSLITLIRLKGRLRGAMPVQNRIFLSDAIDTAFVLGVFRPKIYLPGNLSEAQQRHILLHEQTHIKRLDHIVKLVSFFALCVHWFNPLVWIAFFASGKDMEMSCDEAVIKQLGYNVKKEYSASLLTLATGRRIVGGTPLAFGEGDTKSRISHVLHYRKPTLWVAVVAVIVVVCVVVGLMMNPKKDGDGSAGVNAVILAIDREGQTMTVKGVDQNSVIGDQCIITWEGEPFIKVASNGETEQLSLDDFAVGDAVSLWIGPVQESYPTRATATTIQRQPGAFWHLAETLWEARTQYVGDNSAVGKLIGLLPVPSEWQCDHFALHTASQPYGIEIVYTVPEDVIGQYERNDSSIEELVQKNALLLLVLVENAEGVRTVLTDGSREVVFTSDRTWADEFVGGDVRDYAASPEKLQGLILFSMTEPVQVEYSMTKLGKGGEVLSVSSVNDQQLAGAIILNARIKSLAWYGVDVNTLEESYLIRQTFPEEQETHNYYAYRYEDGTAVLQYGIDGDCIPILEDLYTALVASFD